MTLPRLHSIPRLYPILDAGILPANGDARAAFLSKLGRELALTGLTLLEYRNKTATDADLYADACLLRSLLPETRLVLDDCVDIALAASFDGVHVDSGDLSPTVARALLPEGSIIGTSASTLDALDQALREPVDYISFGPVYPTTTKQTSAAPIGIEGVRRFRDHAGPSVTLVAAAGITLETASAILDAGASSVAVSAAIFRHPHPAEELMRWLKALNG